MFCWFCYQEVPIISIELTDSGRTWRWDFTFLEAGNELVCVCFTWWYIAYHLLFFTQNLDDSVFSKRHAKLELDEKRRKRWGQSCTSWKQLSPRTLTSLHVVESPGALNTLKLLAFLWVSKFELVIIVGKDVWPLFLHVCLSSTLFGTPTHDLDC